MARRAGGVPSLNGLATPASAGTTSPRASLEQTTPPPPWTRPAKPSRRASPGPTCSTRTDNAPISTPPAAPRANAQSPAPAGPAPASRATTSPTRSECKPPSRRRRGGGAITWATSTTASPDPSSKADVHHVRPRRQRIRGESQRRHPLQPTKRCLPLLGVTVEEPGSQAVQESSYPDTVLSKSHLARVRPGVSGLQGSQAIRSGGAKVRAWGRIGLLRRKRPDSPSTSRGECRRSSRLPAPRQPRRARMPEVEW